MARVKSAVEKVTIGAVAVLALVNGVRGGRAPRPAARVGRGDVDDARTGRGGPRKSSPGRSERAAAEAARSERSASKGIVKAVDRFQREHAWLGFPVAVGKKFGEDQAGNLAALIAYYTFFALFPLLLALTTILGFVLQGAAALQARILDSAVAQFPIIGNQIRDNVGNVTGSRLAVVVGLAGAMWAGMRAVDATQNAMNSVWDVSIRDKPKFVSRRLRSLIMLVVVGSALLATAATTTVASAADSLGPAGRSAGPLLSAAVNVGVFLIAFRVLTQRDLSWSAVLPGAVIAGVAAAAFQLAGGFIMARRLEGASRAYGTFAVVIGLLSWLYLQAQVTLLAAEVNVVRARRLWPRSLDEQNLTEADRRALALHAEVEERVPGQDVRTAVPGEAGERGVDRAPDPRPVSPGAS